MIKDSKEAIEHATQTARNLKAEAKAWQGCAIQSKGKAKANECLECAKEHEQLAEWLEELKEYREGKRVCLWCKYDNNECNEYPCNVCKHNHPVMFEHKESEDK